MMVSSCCGSEVYSECGSGKDMIGICCDCHEWCGVDDDTSLDDNTILTVDDMIVG